MPSQKDRLVKAKAACSSNAFAAASRLPCAGGVLQWTEGMEEERGEVTNRATLAIKVCDCALGLLPPGVREWQVPLDLDGDGSIPWLKYWRASPRLREQRIDVPIPQEHAHLFQALGQYLLKPRCHK